MSEKKTSHGSRRIYAFVMYEVGREIEVYMGCGREESENVLTLSFFVFRTYRLSQSIWARNRN